MTIIDLPKNNKPTGYIPAPSIPKDHWLGRELPPTSPLFQGARDYLAKMLPDVDGIKGVVAAMTQEEREGVLDALVGKLTRRANDPSETDLERQTCLACLAEIKAVRQRYGADNG